MNSNNVILLLALLIGLSSCSSPVQKSYDLKMRKAAVVNTKLGAGYLAQGDYRLAKLKLDKALLQDPELPEANATYALLQHKLGNPNLAEKHFRKALRADSSNSALLNNYGTFLCEQSRINDAEKKFLEALKDPLYKTPEYAYTNAGTCVMKHSKYEKAEKYFRKALQINPVFPNALFQMAYLNKRKQQYQLSKKYLDRYHEYAVQTSESLWLAIEVSKALNNKNALASYSLLLKSKFPESKEARNLRANE